MAKVKGLIPYLEVTDRQDLNEALALRGAVWTPPLRRFPPHPLVQARVYRHVGGGSWVLTFIELSAMEGGMLWPSAAII